MGNHVVVVGYGTKGRSAVDTLVNNGQDREAIVVVDPSTVAMEDAHADGLAVVTGAVTSINVQPVGFTEQQLASRYLFTLTMRVEFTDLRENKILWQNPSIQFREEFAVSNTTNVDVNAFFGQNEQQGRRWVPPMDLVEADDHFVLKADLPGLSEGDVSIEVQDGTLTISGERSAEHESHERGWYRIERSFGSFNRSLTLPDGVDPDRIAASFSDGVLEVRIPKPEERKPRRIAIGANGNGHKTIEGSTA